ncbi:hypothetical protein GSP01_19820 [Gluconobacter sphaericus NBRC 12467]|nr:hypothetical protein AA12467_2215 [Gluconobacter sphaericus NBRC 12467]GEB43200.1 hypothetical protein GSP01_19820 [Gluconobacter sphaericus NBRC 12467]
MGNEDNIVRIEDGNDVFCFGQIEDCTDMATVFDPPEHHDIRPVNIVIPDRSAGLDPGLKASFPGSVGIAVAAVQNARCVGFSCNE